MCFHPGNYQKEVSKLGFSLQEPYSKKTICKNRIAKGTRDAPAVPWFRSSQLNLDLNEVTAQQNYECDNISRLQIQPFSQQEQMGTPTHLRETGREEFIDTQNKIDIYINQLYINKGRKSEHVTSDTGTYVLVSPQHKDVFHYKCYEFKTNSSPETEIFKKDRCSTDASVPVHFFSPF